VDIRSLRSVAKIVGTAICLAGAVFMAFFKGPKLLGAVLVSATGDWVKGGIYLVGNAACVSIWYIFQVTTNCTDACNRLASARFNTLFWGGFR
jgi:hypothetical protein